MGEQGPRNSVDSGLTLEECVARGILPASVLGPNRQNSVRNRGNSTQSGPTDHQGNSRSRATSPNPRTASNRPQTSTNAPESSKLSNPNILRKKKHGRAIRRMTAIALTAGVVVGAGATVYETNAFDLRTVARNTMGWPNVTNGPDSMPPVKLDTGSLSLDQCNDPNKAIATVKISADVPLVAQYNNDNAPAYLTKANEKMVAANSRNEYKQFVTDDGFPHFRVRELLFNAAACGTNAVSGETSDHVTIDRPKVQVTLKDPSAAYNAPVIVQPEFVQSPYSKRLERTKLNPAEGKSMTYPIAKYHPGTNGKDSAFDKAMTDTFTNMQSEDQIKAMTAFAEEKIVQQVNGNGGQQLSIEYPDGSTHSLRDVIDNALEYRYGKQITFNGASYNVKAGTQIDPATKLSISSDLKGFDQTQKADIISARIEYGAEKPPADIPIPTEASSTK